MLRTAGKTKLERKAGTKQFRSTAIPLQSRRGHQQSWLNGSTCTNSKTRNLLDGLVTVQRHLNRKFNKKDGGRRYKKMAEYRIFLMALMLPPLTVRGPNFLLTKGKTQITYKIASTMILQSICTKVCNGYPRTFQL